MAAEPESDSWQFVDCLSDSEPEAETGLRIVVRWTRIVLGALHLAKKRRHWGLQGGFLKRVKDRARA